jgi:hypothetical protein
MPVSCLPLMENAHSPCTHTHLHFDVQDAGAPLRGDILHGRERGTVAAPRERSVLNEPVVVNDLLEAFGSGEMVFDTIRLAGPGATGSILIPSQQQSTQQHLGGEGIRETEKPNESG